MGAALKGRPGVVGMMAFEHAWQATERRPQVVAGGVRASSSPGRSDLLCIPQQDGLRPSLETLRFTRVAPFDATGIDDLLSGPEGERSNDRLPVLLAGRRRLTAGFASIPCDTGERLRLPGDQLLEQSAGSRLLGRLSVNSLPIGTLLDSHYGPTPFGTATICPSYFPGYGGGEPLEELASAVDFCMVQDCCLAYHFQ